MRTSTIDQAVCALKRGEAVIFPTETVYGLGVSVEAAAGPDVLYDLKERDRGKPISWLVGDADDLDRYGARVPELARRLAGAYWPGPLTLVVRAADEVPEAFRSNAGTIGLRMPDNATALALVRAAGCPLATTSANLSGRAAAGALDALDPKRRHDRARRGRRRQERRGLHRARLHAGPPCHRARGRRDPRRHPRPRLRAPLPIRHSNHRFSTLLRGKMSLSLSRGANDSHFAWSRRFEEAQILPRWMQGVENR